MSIASPNARQRVPLRLGRGLLTSVIGLALILGVLILSLASPSLAAGPITRPAAQATSISLTNTVIGSGTTTTVALDLSGAVPFSIFTLADPPRVVVDMPDIMFHLTATNLLGGSGPVAAVRYGSFQPGNSRLVVELNRPAAIRAAQINQRGGLWRFSLVLGDSTPAQFAASAGPDKRQGRFIPPVPAPPVMTSTLPAPIPAAAAPAAAIAPQPQPIPPAPSPTAKTSATSPAPTAIAATAPEPKIAAVSPPTPLPSASTSSLAGRKPIIVLDPGHGGIDPGTTAFDGTVEKTLTLAAAREIRSILQASGRYEVHLTRDNDVFVPLRGRMEIGRHMKADVFISLHVNQLDDASIRGLSVFTLSDDASDDEAGALAEAENKADIIAGVDLSHQSSEVTSILIDLAQRETMNLSSRLAEDLMTAVKSQPAGIGPPVELLKKHPHRFAGFAVLKAADVPSMLIEMGYGSNPKEGALLESEIYRRNMGNTLLHALDAFFKHRTVIAGQ